MSSSETNPTVVENKKEDLKLHLIPIDQIEVDSDFNCRGRISPIDVIDLWKSIEQMGLIQPPTVRALPEPREGKTYSVVAGFRRVMAHVVGKQTHVPCRVIHCTEEEAAILNLTENIQRQDLNIMQESKAVEKFYTRGWSQDRIAKELKVSRVWVINRLKLLSMPPEIQNEAAAGLITQAHIVALFEMKDLNKQLETVRKIKEASERGEKIKGKALQDQLPVAASNVAPKKVRSRKEIFDMIEVVMKKANAGLHTRCLAWAAGEISSDDLMSDLN